MTGRDKILAAAFKLFSEKGFAAVGIREIADEAGLTNPALYQHFDGKQALGLEIYQRCYDDLLCEVERQIGTQSNPVECLNAYVNAAVRLHQQQPSPLLFLEDEQRTFFESIKARHGKNMISTQITGWISGGQEKGLIRKDVPARMLTASVIGQITKWAAMSSLGLAPKRGASGYLKQMMWSTLETHAS